ncbi:MAG: hypothetical protein ABIR84_06440 [Candidatus Nitrotoga sp.]
MLLAGYDCAPYPASQTAKHESFSKIGNFIVADAPMLLKVKSVPQLHYFKINAVVVPISIGTDFCTFVTE